MKIAMLTTVGDRCGIAEYTRELIGALDTLPDTEIVVVPISEGRLPTSHYIEQARLLNAPDIDLVHIQHEHSFWGGVMPRASSYWELRYLIQNPVVLTAHTTYSLADLLRVNSERRPHKLLVKRLLLKNTKYRESVDTAPFATAFTIVHTEAARQELVARGVNPQYVAVVPTGVPAPLAAPSNGRDFRAKYGLEGRRLAVIFGYIAPNKGYELVLKILGELPEDVTVVIAGGGRNSEMKPYVDLLQDQIRLSGYENRIIITGYLTDIDAADVMVAADVVLTPHTQATGSYSVTLPLTHGKPILASDMDCFREIQRRVRCMELFKAGDTVDFRDKLLALLANEARCQELSIKALEYARRCSWPAVAAMTRSIYVKAHQIYYAGHHSRPS